MELDLQKTKDGKIVLFEDFAKIDKNIKISWLTKEKINDMNAKELYHIVSEKYSCLK